MTTLMADRPKDTATERDPRWARMVGRDKAADGTFWYSVATTGVYCRPSCPSRTANPRNVRFHDTVEDAEAAGFYACKRCKPNRPSSDVQNAKTAARICRLIERAEDVPSLADLAAAAGLSPGYFHRIFKAVTGVTPKDYAVANRAGKVREKLVRCETVTEAIYGAGFNSNGRFYDKSAEMLGMTPSDYRAGGANMAIRFVVGDCSLASILVASSAKGGCAILIGDDPEMLVHDLQNRFPRASPIGGDANFEQLVARVVGFIEAPAIGLDLPLDVRGTANSAYGQRFGRSRWARPSPTPTSPERLVRRSPFAPWRGPGPPTLWRWRSPVTGWCGTTARFPATAGDRTQACPD